MPLLEADQRSEAWFKAREGKVTASLAAACLGLCPYTSRQEAWRKIRGEGKDSGNRHTRWGSEFEGAARASYEVETGNMIHTTGFWVHPELPWLGASPDGLVGADGLVEIKCPGKLPASVPIHYRMQMLVQLAVTGRQWCDFYVWTHEATLLRRVHLSGWAGLLKRLEAFHRDYVLDGVCPPRKKRKRAA